MQTHSAKISRLVGKTNEKIYSISVEIGHFLTTFICIINYGYLFSYIFLYFLVHVFNRHAQQYWFCASVLNTVNTIK